MLLDWHFRTPERLDFQHSQEETGALPEEGEILDKQEEVKRSQGEVVLRELDKKQTLKECLKGGTVFEFPTLYVSIK